LAYCADIVEGVAFDGEGKIHFTVKTRSRENVSLEIERSELSGQYLQLLLASFTQKQPLCVNREAGKVTLILILKLRSGVAVLELRWIAFASAFNTFL